MAWRWVQEGSKVLVWPSFFLWFCWLLNRFTQGSFCVIHFGGSCPTKQEASYGFLWDVLYVHSAERQKCILVQKSIIPTSSYGTSKDHWYVWVADNYWQQAAGFGVANICLYLKTMMKLRTPWALQEILQTPPDITWPKSEESVIADVAFN